MSGTNFFANVVAVILAKVLSHVLHDIIPNSIVTLVDH